MRALSLAIASLLLLGARSALATPPALSLAPGFSGDVPPLADVDGQGLAQRRAALRQYDLQRVGMASLESYDDDDGSVTYGGLQPYLGRYRRPLDDDEFFDLVGRSDLASQYRLRTHIKYGLLAAAVAGTALATVESVHLLSMGPPTCDPSTPQFESCTESADRIESLHVRNGVILVTGVSVVGPLLITGLALYDPNPVPDWQMRQLADEYDTRLRQKLGLPEDERALLLQSLGMAPFASPGGGGLALNGRF